jgi:hypothetical protein
MDNNKVSCEDIQKEFIEKCYDVNSYSTTEIKYDSIKNKKFKECVKLSEMFMKICYDKNLKKRGNKK